MVIILLPQSTFRRFAAIEVFNINEKTECLRREGYISPLCSAYPPKLLVTPWCMLGPMGDLITHAQFQLNRFRGYGATVTPTSLFPILSDHDPYNS